MAYEFDNAVEMADAFCGRTDSPDYSRVTNPTVIYYQNKVKELAGAENAYALNSGMAAICNILMCLASSGKNIVISNHLFGNTFLLITQTLSRFGVGHKICDLTDIESVKNAIDSNTCCIFTEIITNPHLEVADLRALAGVAHNAGIPLVVDSTMIPFTEFNAHELGADIEMLSSTKYISGGATSIGGLIIDYGTTPGFDARMKEMLLNVGAYMNPHAAYMQTIGLETLDARYRIQASGTLELARRLRSLPQIRKVNYTGLEDNPYHKLSVSQFGKTAGAMLTIDLEDQDACFRMIDRLKVFYRATNLFDNKSLAIHPASTIFGPFTPEERKALDIYDTTIRLSIGLEDPDDLFEDIRQALQ